MAPAMHARKHQHSNQGSLQSAKEFSNVKDNEIACEVGLNVVIIDHRWDLFCIPIIVSKQLLGWFYSF